MDSSIDQKQRINLLSETLLLRQVIMAMIAVAYVCIFQGYHKRFTVVYQKQSRIEPVNARLEVIGGGISEARHSKDSNPLAENTSKPVHVGETALLFQPIILQEAKRHGVDPALIRAIIMAESGYNPKAISGMGARGLMQLMPKTAESLGVVDSFNPEQNIKAGVKYFKQLLNQFEGDVILALAAYNAGARKVRIHEGVPPIKTTRHFIRKVVKYYQHYIFDPYFTTKHEGSGLGLTTTHSIVKKHDGHITVESKLGEGTTFHIYLPASDKSVPEKEEVRMIAGQGRVLVMDDEASLRKIVGRMLAKLGYESEFAEDGAEGIEMYKAAKKSEKAYDAVILDLTVPSGMGGKEAISKLLEIDPEVKAVVSSGYSNDPVLSNFQEYGFKGMMPKTFELLSLGKVLHEVLQGEKE